MGFSTILIYFNGIQQEYPINNNVSWNYTLWDLYWCFVVFKYRNIILIYPEMVIEWDLKTTHDVDLTSGKLTVCY